MSETTTELEQAQQQVVQVHDRIKNLDEKVGLDELEAAERRLRFAQIKAEGEERRRAQAAEQARLQRLQELEERATKELDSGPLDKARQKAAKALGLYIDEVKAHNARIAEIATELESLAPLPDDMVVDHGSYGAKVSLAGREYRPRREVALVADLAREQLRARVRGIIDLEWPA